MHREDLIEIIVVLVVLAIIVGLIKHAGTPGGKSHAQKHHVQTQHVAA